MEFLNPFAFLLLIFVPILWKIKNKKLPFSKSVLNKIVINYGVSKKKRFVFYLLSYIFFITALARPVSGIVQKHITIKKNDIIILLDGSYLMKKNDIYPTRFDAAVEKLKVLFSKLKDQNVGLLIVKDYPYLISPLTTDYNSIIYLLKHINKKQLFDTASNFELAIQKAKKLSKHPVILSISYMPQKGDVVYVINSKKFKNVVNFTYSNQDIKDILSLLSKKENSKTITLTQTNELFYYPLIAGIIFLFLGNFSVRRKN
jgi:Ca-activated chloride channel family protein